MRLKVTHITRYEYDTPIRYGLLRVRMKPWSSDMQTVRSWTEQVDGAHIEAQYTDHYLNHVSLLSIDEGVGSLAIKISGEVVTKNVNGVVGPHMGSAPLWLFRRETPLTTAGPLIDALVDTMRKSGKTGVALLHGLNRAISDAVDYQTGTTDVETTAEGAMEAGTGVCQDQTHVFLSAARKLGFPARYISGYLMMNDRVAQNAGHAWAEAHVDGLGWVSFDISNGISPDERYVKVATGLDYGEAAPISGMRYGTGGESMNVAIQVQQQ